MRRFAWLLIILLLPVALARAQAAPAPEHGAPDHTQHPATVEAPPGAHAESGGHEGSSSIFSGDWGTAIWTLAIFVLLVLILGKFAWKPILEGLQKREDHIRQAIGDAEKARADAEKALAEYKAQLAKAQAEAQALIEKGRADAITLGEELKNKALEEAKALRGRAEKDIELARDEALRQIYDQTVKIATDMAGRIIKKSLNPEDHRGLLQDSLNKIQNGKK